jgi:hypothetical protein
LKNLSSIPLPDQYGAKLKLDNNHLIPPNVGTSDSELIAWLDSHNPGWETTQTPCPGTNCEEVTEIPTTECKALVKFYNSTDGEQWNDNAGWNLTNTPCNWYGVTCRNGHVKKLELSSNQLSGIIPKKLAKLEKLKTLDLSFNQLEGSIPADLKKLKKLKTLLLNNNELCGEIPVKLKKLQKLSWLSLDYNHLTASDEALIAWLDELNPATRDSNALSWV